MGDPGDRVAGGASSLDGWRLAASGNDADLRLWRLAEILGTRTRP